MQSICHKIEIHKQIAKRIVRVGAAPAPAPALSLLQLSVLYREVSKNKCNAFCLVLCITSKQVYTVDTFVNDCPHTSCFFRAKVNYIESVYETDFVVRDFKKI